VAFVLLFMGACTLYNSVALQESFAIMWNAEEPPIQVINDTTIQLSAADTTVTLVLSNDDDDSQSLDPQNNNVASLDTALELLGKNKPLRKKGGSLPDALQPVTYGGCCPKKEGRFMQTCLTEKACEDDTLYPFTSQQEADMFARYTPDGPDKLILQRRCDKANAQIRPPTTWCSNTTTSSRKKFPMGCSAFSMAGGSGPYDRLLLFPSGKLAFCAIPKAGITQWLQFLRFTLGAKDYQSMPYYKKDSKNFHFDRLQPHIQDEIWNGGEWTKAILIREPAERLLSAYLDKVVPKPSGRGQINDAGNENERDQQSNNNEDQGRRRLKVPFGPNVTFADFVDILAMENITKLGGEYRGTTGISWQTDPHWRPQAWSCGLSENMKQFDYIGSLDNAAFHTKALLQQVDMWDSYGKHYRVSEKGETKGTAAATWPPPPLQPGEKAEGFQQQGTNDNDKHNRNSRNKLDKYYTPELMKKVREIYWMDFALWDALKEAEKEGKVRGKDIVAKLNPECR